MVRWEWRGGGRGICERYLLGWAHILGEGAYQRSGTCLRKHSISIIHSTSSGGHELLFPLYFLCLDRGE